MQSVPKLVGGLLKFPRNNRSPKFPHTMLERARGRCRRRRRRTASSVNDLFGDRWKTREEKAKYLSKTPSSSWAVEWALSYEFLLPVCSLVFMVLLSMCINFFILQHNVASSHVLGSFAATDYWFQSYFWINSLLFSVGCPGLRQTWTNTIKTPLLFFLLLLLLLASREAFLDSKIWTGGGVEGLKGDRSTDPKLMAAWSREKERCLMDEEKKESLRLAWPPTTSENLSLAWTKMIDKKCGIFVVVVLSVAPWRWRYFCDMLSLRAALPTPPPQTEGRACSVLRRTCDYRSSRNAISLVFIVVLQCHELSSSN